MQNPYRTKNQRRDNENSKEKRTTTDNKKLPSLPKPTTTTQTERGGLWMTSQTSIEFLKEAARDKDLREELIELSRERREKDE